jgi:hypothetical protein
MSIPPQMLSKNVYCGKDKRLTEEEGNMIFKALILENVERYNRVKEKSSKMRMTAEFLEEFRIRSNGGQFYKYCKDVHDWVLCDDGWVRDKVSHALRFQIKRSVRRPRLQRTLSLSAEDSPAKKKQRRNRSESFDSCPAKIESVPTQDLSDDWNSGSLDGTLDESILVDPLTLFDEMVSSGELDQFDFSYANSDDVALKNIDTRELYCMDEILTDAEEDDEWNELDDL